MILPPPDKIDVLIELFENYLDRNEEMMKRYRSLEKIRDIWPGGMEYLFAQKMGHVEMLLYFLKNLK